MSDKLAVAIYKVKEEITSNDLFESIKSKGYSEQTIVITDNIWDISLYYQRYSSDIRWKNFIRPIVDQSADVIKFASQPKENIIIVYDNKLNDCIYIVTTGSAYHSISMFINPEFGISILSRIIRKDSKVIKATKEASIAGGILGETKFFRQNYNIYENETFGSFYQELITSIDKEILLTKLGFTEDEIKREALCIAKNSFKISKSITFTQVIAVINGLEDILSTLPPIEINNVRKLNRSIDKILISNLKLKLLKCLYRNYKNYNGYYNYDLCHSDFEKYLTASYYQIQKGHTVYSIDQIDKLTDIKQVYSILINRDGIINKFKLFIEKYKDLKIVSFDDNSIIQTSGKILSHVIADVEFFSKRYFFIDDSWYLINPTYLKELNEECKEFITAHYSNQTLLTWDNNITENDYNSKYIGQPDTIVLDKVLCENIEVCDYLNWTNDSLYLYHVKIGFGNRMRELCSQIFISAQRLKRDLASGKLYIGKYYDSLRNKIGNDSYFNKIGLQTKGSRKNNFTFYLDLII